MVVGGTAVGGSPHLHALDAETGDILWQQGEAGPTFAAALEVNGVVFLGGTDYTLRAVDLQTGDVLWSQEMQGAVSGGAVAAGDDLVAVAGHARARLLRAQPHRRGVPVLARPTPTTRPPAPPRRRRPRARRRAAPSIPLRWPSPASPRPCPLDFTLTAERVGGQVGTGTLHITADPFRIEVDAEGLGDPTRWLRPGSAAADAGASVFAVFMSQGTDDPVGGLVVRARRRTSTAPPTRSPTRAPPTTGSASWPSTNPAAFPPIAEGFDRMVATNTLEVPFAPRGG